MRDTGLSLIEMTFAILVLSIGLVGAFYSLQQSGRMLGTALPRILANHHAMNHAEALRVLSPEDAALLPNRLENGRFVWDVTITHAAQAGGLVEATVTLSGAGHPGARARAYLVSVLP